MIREAKYATTSLPAADDGWNLIDTNKLDAASGNVTNLVHCHFNISTAAAQPVNGTD
jgi:hypothetical protein